MRGEYNDIVLVDSNGHAHPQPLSIHCSDDSTMEFPQLSLKFSVDDSVLRSGSQSELSEAKKIGRSLTW